MEPPAKIKTYTVVRNSTFNYRKLEIRHDNVPFVWCNLQVKFFSTPTIYMQTKSPTGPVIAAAKFPVFGAGVDVLIGDPEASGGSSQWTNVERDGLGTGSYSFRGYGDGHLFTWKRTHNSALGSRSGSFSDYKLVDPSNGNKVLAAYIKDSMWGGPEVGHIDFYVELGSDLELQVMTAILGIEERLRRSRRKGANAGAAGGVGGGIAGGAGC